jgi:predicted metalloprotease
MAKVLVLVVALALALCGLPACGGSDDDGAATTGTAAATTTTQPTGGADIEGADAEKMDQPVSVAAPDPTTSEATRATAEFLRAAFDSAQVMWQRHFSNAGARYEPGHLIFFHTKVHTPCGEQTAETGPFYCPPAHGIYLNTDFFHALNQSFNLRSGFAAAYVTAHEVGHHVQNLLGVLGRVAQQDAADPAGASARSIATELQADCYAGVWIHELQGAGALSQSDLEDIIRAAAVVGDDFQRNHAGLELAPETWTHGSSEQRVHWLDVGRRTGSPAACDTFNDDSGPQTPAATTTTQTQP